MARFIVPVAALLALIASTAGLAMVPPGGDIGAGSGEPTAELYSWYYFSENDQTQYQYKLYGNSWLFGVCRFDLYADCDPALLTVVGIGPYNWTSHIEGDGYGGAHMWSTANTEADCLWGDISPNYTRFSLLIPGNVEPSYDYKWPGFAGDTNWSYRSDPSGTSVEGNSMVGVPTVVPEPATLVFVLAGCAGALLKKRR